MKTIKIFSVVSLVAVMLSGCAQSWLDSEPTAGSLTQEQFDELSGTIDGQVLGLYSLINPSSSNHASFGQKSVDLVTDLIASDMAMTARAYGWFVTDAQLTSNTTSSGRNSEFWFNNYYLIKNCNLALKRIVDSPDFATDATIQSNYAQALSMRGYAYMNLYYLYIPSVEMLASKTMTIADLDPTMTFPVYVETSRVDSAQGGASVLDIQIRIIEDFKTAISYFDKSDFKRADKLYFDATLAKAHLAKFYLEIAENDSAFKYAVQVIDESDASILTKDQLLTNGFNDYTTDSWLWGVNTIVTNRGGLRSFWSHVDVYTYGYSPGAPKVIDNIFYKEDVKEQHPGDMRAQWFNRATLNPYKKFFSAKCDRTVVDALDAVLDTAPGNKALIAELQAKILESNDRDWLSDDVYMRIEEMHLIAAESAAHTGKLDLAAYYLIKICEERYDTAIVDDIASDIRAMADGGKEILLPEIKYNWRIEFWGEGRSLQTMKRFNYKTTRGTNHFALAGEEVDPWISGLFAIPYAETSTNQNYPKN